MDICNYLYHNTISALHMSQVLEDATARAKSVLVLHLTQDNSNLQRDLAIRVSNILLIRKETSIWYHYTLLVSFWLFTTSHVALSEQSDLIFVECPDYRMHNSMVIEQH